MSGGILLLNSNLLWVTHSNKTVNQKDIEWFADKTYLGEHFRIVQAVLEQSRVDSRL